MLLHFWCMATACVSLEGKHVPELHWSVTHPRPTTCPSHCWPCSKLAGRRDHQRGEYLPHLPQASAANSHFQPLEDRAVPRSLKPKGAHALGTLGCFPSAEPGAHCCLRPGCRAKRHGQPPWRRGRNRCEMISRRNLNRIKSDVKGEAAMRIAGEFRKVQVGLRET